MNNHHDRANYIFSIADEVLRDDISNELVKPDTIMPKKRVPCDCISHF